MLVVIVVTFLPPTAASQSICLLMISACSSDESIGLAAISTVAGTGAGALLGVVIGAASSRWQLRYASPPVALQFSPLRTQRLGVGLSIRLPAVRR